MPIPTPEAGLVISYACLWDHEGQAGLDEGRKDRACVIALAVQRQQTGATLVTVLPITHRPPVDLSAAVEIPRVAKRQLGLDDDRSWVVVSEGDQFVWPEYDLRKAAGSNQYQYGFLPPKFFTSVLQAFREWHRTHKVRLTPR